MAGGTTLLIRNTEECVDKGLRLEVLQIICSFPDTDEAAGVQFFEVDKKLFYDATQPVRDKYGAKYAGLLKQIQAS